MPQIPSCRPLRDGFELSVVGCRSALELLACESYDNGVTYQAFRPNT